MQTLTSDDSSRLLSDVIARLQAVEKANQANTRKSAAVANVAVSGGNGPLSMSLFSSHTILATGTTSQVTVWTAAGASNYLPNSAVYAVVQFNTVTGEDNMDVSVSPDGVGYFIACGSQSDSGPAGNVGVKLTRDVPLGPNGDFYYKVTGSGTTSWTSWSIVLVGYLS